MSSASEVLALLPIIYSDVVEPIFCLLYAYILIRIVIAKSLNYRSEFYVFSIATGVAAITNVLLNLALRLVDNRFQYFPDRGFYLNINSMLSHICAMAISIGKTLSVSTRFTAICFMHKKNLWEGRVIPICLLVMIGFPTLANCYFPFFPPVFATTDNGYGKYIGIANPGQMIAKAFATCGYLFFFLTTVPMCILSVLKLRRERIRRVQERRLDSDRHEKLISLYAVVLTTSHMFKSVLQSIWFVALVLDMNNLQSTAVSLYLLPNSLSAFAEPVLLLITSPKLREEVFPWTRTKVSNVTNTTVSPMEISNQSRRRSTK